MGFLDNAKNKLSSALGADDEDEEVIPKNKKGSKTSKIDEEEDKESSNLFSGLTKKVKKNTSKNNNSSKNSIIDPEDNEEEEDEDYYYGDSESAFDIEDGDDFFEQKQKEYDNAMKRYKDVPDLGLDKRIEDVLEVLEIPSTFEIEADIFIPDDLDDVLFDRQTPVGYEMGQVDYFVTQSKNSVKRYYDLLKLRNEHVAKMASVVDKLQVSINNLKLQQEINAGINVMTTDDDEDWETKYTEAVLHIKRLEDEQKRKNNKETISKQQKEKYLERIKELRDQISILQRENNDLQEENYSLKNQIAQQLENEDDFPIKSDDESYDNNNDYSIEEITEDPEESYEELPSLTDVSLPDLSNIAPPPAPSQPSKKKVNSVFMVDDDEEDDDLDKIMEDWNK